jgi:site-specific DNA-cytosine methylase
MPKLLELFSGTGSVGTVAESLGWEVTSLDINNKTDADIKTNILDWDYQSHSIQNYDFIWASPPCTEYSIAKTVGTRNLDLADSIVKKTWEIIEHFKPRLGYVMENPQTGMLKTRPMMVGKSYADINYCKYGMPYRKRTRLWNNIQHLF